MPEPVLAIGPANYAGQAYEWAAAATRHLPVQAWSFTRGPIRRDDFAFPASVAIPAIQFHAPVAHQLRARRLLRGATHVALDGFQPFFRLLRKRVFARDARWVVDQGFDLALIAHGTDVRDPARHQQRLEWSYFNEGSSRWRQKLTEFVARNHDTARELGIPVFVSTPDLLLDLPEATWLPVCVDVSLWESDEPPLQRKVPQVLHMPSRRTPPIKGTQYVEPVMKELAARGLIEYISPATVPHTQMPDLVRGCDIVVDQILTGSYGVAAVEAMAAGRVVIGSLARDVADSMPQAPGIFNTAPDTLGQVIRQILDDRAAAQEQAQANIDFVRQWHDGRAAAKALAGFLGVSAKE